MSSSYPPSGRRSARLTRELCGRRGPTTWRQPPSEGALERVPQLDPKEIEDVILGCAMPEAEQGMNVARIASLRAGLPVDVSAMTINRFCSSGLQAIAMAAERIMAGGAEISRRRRRRVDDHDPHGRHTRSRPIRGWCRTIPTRISRWGSPPSGWPSASTSRASRSDEFSVQSHKKAIAAIEAGKFDDEIVPVPVSFTTPNGSKPKRTDIIFKMDEGPRADTSLEALLR